MLFGPPLRISFGQADAVLIDSSGGKHRVHSWLLRLLFPIFWGIKRIQYVTLDGVTPAEVKMLLELIYGQGRYVEVYSGSHSQELIISAINVREGF